MTLLAERSPGRLHMSEEQFAAWCRDDVRAEFVDGEVIIMSPVLAIHDDLFHFLARLIGVYLEVRPVGIIRGSEFQVRLREGLRRVPDLLFIANDHLDRVQSSYVDGAPDAAFEIVSEDSVDRDWRDKFLDYQASGVLEYWVVDPAHRAVRLYRLVDGRYIEVSAENGRMSSTAIPGFWLKVDWLWTSPRPGALVCLREMGLLT
jgi:Uma2 family endonuclease